MFNLAHYDKFVNRHIGINDADKKEMLQTIGVKKLDQLINETVPRSIRMKGKLNIPARIARTPIIIVVRCVKLFEVTP